MSSKSCKCVKWGRQPRHPQQKRNSTSKSNQVKWEHFTKCAQKESKISSQDGSCRDIIRHSLGIRMVPCQTWVICNQTMKEYHILRCVNYTMQVLLAHDRHCGWKFRHFFMNHDTLLDGVTLGLLLKDNLKHMNNCECMKSCFLTEKGASSMTLHGFGRKCCHGNCKPLFTADFSIHCCILITAFVSLWSAITESLLTTKMYFHARAEYRRGLLEIPPPVLSLKRGWGEPYCTVGNIKYSRGSKIKIDCCKSGFMTPLERTIIGLSKLYEVMPEFTSLLT